MSEKRCMVYEAWLQFDDSSTRELRKISDLSAEISNVFSMFATDFRDSSFTFPFCHQGR